ncbi:iron reductase [Gloeophyllum trabeum ATCC 11539]|uniref:ferric-chelate reductase (NADPH) n=1 Tax=Gloeophyllum trabeum (strain ATCC 11539 / FP-39264 / Madison 617) TaxID=670483 RepID=S7RRG8_GLOTA|nr:iron reductase [Gloeophyllum trabeum ATCC 11539]EPQ55534.1 iron reductase [Gloeophyllum trabeum ATCC 11539]
MSGIVPTIPTEFQQYNSYVTDPAWQRKFSIVWASFTGFAILLALPRFLRAVRRGQVSGTLFGISEDLGAKGYRPAVMEDRMPTPTRRWRLVNGVVRSAAAALLWTIPKSEISLGQILVIAGYLATILVCIIKDAPLVENPNRAGFLAIAQLPVVFLFATKNSILSLLLGPGNGYEKLNYIHKWSGRGAFLGALIHGALWIRNHIEFDLPILGQQKETSGVAAFALLCILVLTSLRPVRRYCYQVFFYVHILSSISFFITLCYHTIYATPWIFPPLAFYGLDLLLRLLRYRIKDATVVPVSNDMTLINVNDCDGGWTPGQHVRLRVFFSDRVFESHPLTIACAPPSTSCLSTPGLILGARAVGDWSHALHAYARRGLERIALSDQKSLSVPVQVMLDGPYGGCSVDLGAYESALLVAGGSGVTFSLAVLDDIVGRCCRLGRRGGEKTRRIEFAWCVRSFGCIEWFAPQLIEVAKTCAGTSLDLHVSIFVTCLCNPEAVPDIPNSDVSIHRPAVHTLLQELVTPPSSTSSLSDEESSEKVDLKGKLNWVGLGGGVAVCAAGPETMTREAQNAVARISATRGVQLGGVSLHTELFAL